LLQGRFPKRGELPMTMEDRVESLKARHALLEQEIDDEAHRPLPNTIHVTELKRQKLRIKEEIARMR
jgi:hypothetical protein